MAQEDKSFLKTLDVWKRKSWILFATEKQKKFWCNLSEQYKVTLRDEKNTQLFKIIYIGQNLDKAYKVWLEI